MQRQTDNNASALLMADHRSSSVTRKKRTRSIWTSLIATTFVTTTCSSTLFVKAFAPTKIPASVKASEKSRMFAKTVAKSTTKADADQLLAALVKRQKSTFTKPSLYTSGEDDDDVEEVDFSISDFMELQDSTGLEVLQSKLQHQIDQAMKVPDLFLDMQGDDNPSDLEKMAMSSVTAQLPQRAMQAFNKSNKLNYSSERVSHERELQLARFIQKGAALQACRKDLVNELRREPTKQEWADRANLSAKELRRRISQYRQAKQELVTANLGLVHAVVNQQWGSLKRKSTGITKEELVQEGSLGLLRAAELFDPTRGLRFSTYAVVWIKGTLSNSHLSELVKLPNREKTRWNKIVKVQKDLEESYGRPATMDQLVTAIDLTPEQILATKQHMSRTQRVLSLDYEYQQQSRSGMKNSGVGMTLQIDKNLFQDDDDSELTQLNADVLAVLARNLGEREARLMRLRYGLSDGRPRSLTECAQAMGLSYTRVYQLADQCIKKLKTVKEVEALEEYFLTVA